MKKKNNFFEHFVNSDVNKTTSCVLGVSGIIANLCGFLICLIDGAPITGKLATGACLLFLIAYSAIAYKLKWYNAYNLSISFLACNVAFPAIFFGTGGIQKAFVFYLFIAAVAYGVSMRKWWYAVFPIATLLEYNICIAFSYNRVTLHNLFGNVRLTTLLLGFNVMFVFIFCFLVFFLGITSRYYNQLNKQVFHDELTRLYNRRRFNEDVKEEKYRFGIMMDIDNFHEVNNKYGHQYGDLVLQKLAEICLSFACDEFKVYRYGGEEFFILSRLPRSKTFKNIRDIQSIFESDLNQTLSVGMASKIDYEPYQKTIKRADEYMYFVKHNGKNNISFDGTMLDKLESI